MKEIQEIVKRVKELLFDLDCTDYKQRMNNQKKVSKAYNLLEKIEEKFCKKEV